ncbi:MAG: hypothetical protein WC352_08185, partial [Candidatus Omnitrophota bacterium]
EQSWKTEIDVEDFDVTADLKSEENLKAHPELKDRIYAALFVLAHPEEADFRIFGKSGPFARHRVIVFAYDMNGHDTRARLEDYLGLPEMEKIGPGPISVRIPADQVENVIDQIVLILRAIFESGYLGGNDLGHLQNLEIEENPDGSFTLKLPNDFGAYEKFDPATADRLDLNGMRASVMNVRMHLKKGLPAYAQLIDRKFAVLDVNAKEYSVRVNPTDYLETKKARLQPDTPPNPEEKKTPEEGEDSDGGGVQVPTPSPQGPNMPLGPSGGAAAVAAGTGQRDEMREDAGAAASDNRGVRVVPVTSAEQASQEGYVVRRINKDGDWEQRRYRVVAVDGTGPGQARAYAERFATEGLPASWLEREKALLETIGVGNAHSKEKHLFLVDENNEIAGVLAVNFPRSQEVKAGSILENGEIVQQDFTQQPEFDAYVHGLVLESKDRGWGGAHILFAYLSDFILQKEKKDQLVYGELIREGGAKVTAQPMAFADRLAPNKNVVFDATAVSTGAGRRDEMRTAEKANLLDPAQVLDAAEAVLQTGSDQEVDYIRLSLLMEYVYPQALGILGPDTNVFDFLSGANLLGGLFGKKVWTVDKRLTRDALMDQFQNGLLPLLTLQGIPQDVDAGHGRGLLPAKDPDQIVIEHSGQDVLSSDFLKSWTSQMKAGDVVYLRHTLEYLILWLLGNKDMDDQKRAEVLANWLTDLFQSIPQGVHIVVVESDQLMSGRSPMQRLAQRGGDFGQILSQPGGLTAYLLRQTGSFVSAIPAADQDRMNQKIIGHDQYRLEAEKETVPGQNNITFPVGGRVGIITKVGSFDGSIGLGTPASRVLETSSRTEARRTEQLEGRWLGTHPQMRAETREGGVVQAGQKDVIKKEPARKETGLKALWSRIQLETMLHLSLPLTLYPGGREADREYLGMLESAIRETPDSLRIARLVRRKGLEFRGLGNSLFKQKDETMASRAKAVLADILQRPDAEARQYAEIFYWMMDEIPNDLRIPLAELILARPTVFGTNLGRFIEQAKESPATHIKNVPLEEVIGALLRSASELGGLADQITDAKSVEGVQALADRHAKVQLERVSEDQRLNEAVGEELGVLAPDAGIHDQREWQAYVAKIADNLAKGDLTRENVSRVLGYQLPAGKPEERAVEFADLLLFQAPVLPGETAVYLGGDGIVLAAVHRLILEYLAGRSEGTIPGNPDVEALLQKRKATAAAVSQDYGNDITVFDMSRQDLSVNSTEFLALQPLKSGRRSSTDTAGLDNSLVQSTMSELIRQAWAAAGEDTAAPAYDFGIALAEGFARELEDKAIQSKGILSAFGQDPEMQRIFQDHIERNQFAERAFALFLDFYEAVFKSRDQVVISDIAQTGVQPLFLYAAMSYLKGIRRGAEKQALGFLSPGLRTRVLDIVPQLENKRLRIQLLTSSRVAGPLTGDVRTIPTGGMNLAGYLEMARPVVKNINHYNGKGDAARYLRSSVEDQNNYWAQMLDFRDTLLGGSAGRRDEMREGGVPSQDPTLWEKEDVWEANVLAPAEFVKTISSNAPLWRLNEQGPTVNGNSITQVTVTKPSGEILVSRSRLHALVKFLMRTLTEGDRVTFRYGKTGRVEGGASAVERKVAAHPIDHAEEWIERYMKAGVLSKISEKGFRFLDRNGNPVTDPLEAHPVGAGDVSVVFVAVNRAGEKRAIK